MSAPASAGPEFHCPDRRDGAAANAAMRICALLPEAETALSTLQCAVAASQGIHSEICAVHVGFDPKTALVSAEEQDIQQLRDLYEGGPQARTARVKAAFDAFGAAAPDAPPIVWRDDAGDIQANVALEAAAADLVVIGRPLHMDAADALHGALFDAHCLVLVAPRTACPARTLGRHIVVGWKPGAPIEQAAAAALPWLRRAEKVSLLWARKPGAESYDSSARAFFARLGIAADIIRLERNEQSVGAQLLAEAQRLGGDCLLIGAFKHGALWQAVLGGVTRDVLALAEIPVFMMRAK